jgi:hypothetical protein
VYLPGLSVTVTVEVSPVPTMGPSLSTPWPDTDTPCLNEAGLAITTVTLPALAVSVVVLKASLPGSADRWSV